MLREANDLRSFRFIGAFNVIFQYIGRWLKITQMPYSPCTRSDRDK